MSVENKLEEVKGNRQEALQGLQEAQTRVQELTALIQRQSGAITALEELIELSNAEGHVTSTAPVHWSRRGHMAYRTGSISLCAWSGICRRS